MKRLWVILGALAMVCALNVTVAKATSLVQEPLLWQNSVGQTATVGGYNFPATNALGVGETDTTATFSAEGWALPSGVIGDSLVIGWILMFPDTNVAASISATSFTINIDAGGAGAILGNLGTTGAVTFTDFTTTDKLVKIPIYINFGSTRGLEGTKGNFGTKMRMRIVPIGGTFPAARLQLLHWTDKY